MMSRCEKVLSKSASVMVKACAEQRTKAVEMKSRVPLAARVLDLSYMRQEVGKGLDASRPGSPAQRRILRVGTRHGVGGAGVVSGGGGGGAGQVDRSPKHEVTDVTHRVENLQREPQTSLGMKTKDNKKMIWKQI